MVSLVHPTHTESLDFYNRLVLPPVAPGSLSGDESLVTVTPFKAYKKYTFIIFFKFLFLSV